MQEAVIVSGARTPMGAFGGVFKDCSAADLGASAIRAAISRANVSPEDVNEVVIGNVLQAESAGYAPRMAALIAGIPAEVPAIAINRVCSSGLEAINMAAQLIRTGEAEIVVAGGIESMSQSPFLLSYKARFDGIKMGDTKLRDSLLEGLTCPVNRYHMGVGAENVAEQFEINRRDQDELALLSHKRAVYAMQNGLFENQITDVEVREKRGETIVVNTDEGPRTDSSYDSLSKLRPVFKKEGTITAGNASSINDGAAAVVVMSAEKASVMGVRPILKWRARGVAGVDPALFATGPVPAVRKVIDQVSMNIQDIDLIELNEAFAAQALQNIRELGLDVEKTNVNGSGISLGHPIGATGAVMTVKLMEEMVRRDDEIGLVTMCVGGGMGVATIFQRLN